MNPHLGMETLRIKIYLECATGCDGQARIGP